jgi:hypothetical protein
MRQRVAAEAAPTILNHRFSMTQGSRLKPLPPNIGFCRRGFSPEHLSSRTQRVAAEAAPTKHRSFCRRGFSPEPPPSMTQGSRRKSPLQPRTPVLDDAKGRGESRSSGRGSRPTNAALAVSAHRFVYACPPSRTARPLAQTARGGGGSCIPNPTRHCAKVAFSTSLHYNKTDPGAWT